MKLQNKRAILPYDDCQQTVPEIKFDIKMLIKESLNPFTSDLGQWTIGIRNDCD